MHNRVTWCRTNLTVGISALWWKARYSTRCRKTISANISLRLPINRTRIRREILENAKLPVESAAYYSGRLFALRSFALSNSSPTTSSHVRRSAHWSRCTLRCTRNSDKASGSHFRQYAHEFVNEPESKNSLRKAIEFHSRAFPARKSKSTGTLLFDARLEQ